jgi:acetyltransferase-like isoleucine patch superfamily enzyme
VRDGITIGADVIVGVGAAVTTDLPDGVTAVGVPARVMRKAAVSLPAPPAETPE